MGGDILGFVAIAAFLFSEWAWIQNILGSLPHKSEQAADRLRHMWMPVRSALARWALGASIVVVLLEVAIVTAAHYAASEPYQWWMKLAIGLGITCTVVQLVFAVWNKLTGEVRHIPAQLDPVTGDVVVPGDDEPAHLWFVNLLPAWMTQTPANPNSLIPPPPRPNPNKRVDLHKVVKLSHPLLWLGFVAVYMLLQGMAIETHGTKYETYLSAQAMVLIGFMSSVVYGIASLVVADALGMVIRKGTRLVERGSTMAAKLALAALPHYTFANSLKEMGGEIDIIDEDYVAALQDFILTAPFASLVVYHMAMLVVPNTLVQWGTLLATVLAGILAWSFARSDEVSRKKVGHATRITKEILFKVGVPLGILAFVAGILLYGTAAGLEVRESIANFWYGVTFHAYEAWYRYVSYIIVGLAAYIGLYIFRTLSKNSSEKNAKHSAEVAVKAAAAATPAEKTAILTGDTTWAESVWRYLSYAFFLGMLASVFFSAGSCWGASHRLMGDQSFRLGMQAQDSAVVIAPGTIVNHGAQLVCPTPANPANPCTLAAQVEENGTKKVLLSFTTQKRASGIVEFTDPDAAVSAGLPPYLTVNSQLDGCGTGTSKLCEHTASFEIPTGPYPGYKIVMRNDEQPKPSAAPNPLYGKVETYAVSPGVQETKQGFWASVVAWWRGKFSRTPSPPPGPAPVVTTTATVTVAPPAPKPPARTGGGNGGSRVATRCTSGCDLPPLEVLPQFR